MLPRPALVAHEQSQPGPVLLDEGLERPQRRRIDPAPGSLDLDRDLAVAEDVVDLEAALRALEARVVIELAVGAVRQELHQDEVLECPAERLAALRQQVVEARQFDWGHQNGVHSCLVWCMGAGTSSGEVWRLGLRQTGVF